MPGESPGDGMTFTYLVYDRWTPTGSWRCFAGASSAMQAHSIANTAKRMASPEWPDYAVKVELKGGM